MRALTPDEMDMATMLWRGRTLEDIAAKHKCSTKTVQRKKASPGFVKFIENLEHGTALQVSEAVEGIREAIATVVWNRNESAKRKLKIADDSKASNFDKLAAMRSLDEMYGIAKGPAAAPDGEDAPEKPDVYQAEWMRKPQ